ncbi:uncharacterized protein B0I36DRAFT_87759 [Microdochium trichocladiopsis]|uniref:Uncharacterized protein n=1 Tax=Microdochium trichocladiopsis TaxID=1682393 RepID=A0A9P8YDR0_9PEZI|nr:uncharacterized protein B0I36DRAFT_87759 [Microdochium trichocladiopsis]KAH7035081.1 hypothetical protein B0I36DRAFT_87759 [Microdochium trichocladiopsis]
MAGDCKIGGEGRHRRADAEDMGICRGASPTCGPGSNRQVTQVPSGAAVADALATSRRSGIPGSTPSSTEQTDQLHWRKVWTTVPNAGNPSLPEVSSRFAPTRVARQTSMTARGGASERDREGQHQRRSPNRQPDCPNWPMTGPRHGACLECKVPHLV